MAFHNPMEFLETKPVSGKKETDPVNGKKEVKEGIVDSSFGFEQAGKGEQIFLTEEEKISSVRKKIAEDDPEKRIQEEEYLKKAREAEVGGNYNQASEFYLLAGDQKKSQELERIRSVHQADRDFYEGRSVLTKEDDASGLVGRLRQKFFGKRAYYKKVKIFDPELMLDSVKLEKSKEEKKGKLDLYKKELLAQKMGLMEIQNKLFEELENNPEISAQELRDSVAEMMESAKLTGWQQQAVEKVLGLCQEKREEIKFFKEVAVDPETGETDTKKAAALVFGFIPKGEVEVIFLKLGVYFKMHSIEDFVAAREGISPYETMSSSHIDRSKKTLGIFTHKEPIAFPRLKGSIMVENTNSIQDEKDYDSLAREVLLHEERHLFNYMLREVFNPDIDNFFQADKLHIGLSKIKDEISAFFAEENSDASFILNSVLSYVKGLNLSEEDAEKVKLAVGNGVLAFHRMLQSGFSKKEAQALLFSESLKFWPRVVERFTGKKEAEYEKEVERRIQQVENLDDLYDTIEKHVLFIKAVFVGGHEKLLSADYIISVVEEYREEIKRGERDNSIFDRGFLLKYGIKDKARELVEKEEV